MALVKCPECTHQVSDQASSCPSCGFPLSRDGVGQTAPSPKAPARTTARKIWAIAFFAMAGANLIYVIRHFVVLASVPGSLSPSPFDTTAGAIDAILRLLFFVGIPYAIGMGIWGGFRRPLQVESTQTKKTMLVGGRHFGEYVDVDPTEDIAVVDGQMYRRNDQGIFLFVG